MSYKVEIIEKNDPTVQLEARKLSIKNLFSDLLNELKGFKYQITVEVTLIFQLIDHYQEVLIWIYLLN